jgi:hypothetical protein
MEGRVGVKLGILAMDHCFLILIVKAFSLGLVFPLANRSPMIFYILFSIGILITLYLMTVGSMRVLAKPELMEKLYKEPAAGVWAGFGVCFPVAYEFIVDGEYFVGDAITATFLFLCGIFLIISGIVMIREVKEEAQQVNHDGHTLDHNAEFREHDDDFSIPTGQ